MIVVRIELWPFGDSRRLCAIEELTIVNVGRIEGDRCRYEARHGEAVGLIVHDRGDGALVLLAKALGVLGFGEHGQGQHKLNAREAETAVLVEST